MTVDNESVILVTAISLLKFPLTNMHDKLTGMIITFHDRRVTMSFQQQVQCLCLKACHACQCMAIVVELPCSSRLHPPSFCPAHLASVDVPWHGDLRGTTNLKHRHCLAQVLAWHGDYGDACPAAGLRLPNRDMVEWQVVNLRVVVLHAPGTDLQVVVDLSCQNIRTTWQEIDSQRFPINETEHCWNVQPSWTYEQRILFVSWMRDIWLHHRSTSMGICAWVDNCIVWCSFWQRIVAPWIVWSRTKNEVMYQISLYARVSFMHCIHPHLSCEYHWWLHVQIEIARILTC